MIPILHSGSDIQLKHLKCVQRLLIGFVSLYPALLYDFLARRVYSASAYPSPLVSPALLEKNPIVRERSDLKHDATTTLRLLHDVHYLTPQD